MSTKNFDVCVIGAGPGGYVSAIRSAQLGLSTCVIEREYLGGVCLNVGCIPSKAMISAAHFFHRMNHDAAEMGLKLSSEVKLDMPQLQKWKTSVCERMSSGVKQLLKGNGVEIIEGEAHFSSSKELVVKSQAEGEITILAKNFVIATGSRPIEIPGFAFDEKNVLSSTGGLALNELPKKLVVIGGGYIGLEIAGFLAKLGSKVTVLEAAQDFLFGVADKECVQVVIRKLKKLGVELVTQAKANGYKKSGKALVVEAIVAGEKKTFEGDKILVTVGRKPNSDQMNLKKIGIQIDEKGFVKVDAQRRTSLPGVYAIGDIACQPMLAHKASYEGVLVAEVMAGTNRAYDVKTVPAVIFTDPEIASAGMTEEEAKQAGYADLKIAKFPLAANGRAVSLMETDGFVKMIADAKTNIILGVHIVGVEASNLISEAALAIEMSARLEDIALTIHPHPTLGETMMEAAEATLGHAIHVIQRPLSKSNGRSKEATPR
ncbi:MAG: dihydrolipoyl dehydrogenase [Bdellovibrionales bacterium CG10_big_fil_rev_8_21_14_0_10_45_34]|nr:MAG: dihydrolipoyl dehydrogenase [Bdellovibrionales bacterium CG10_big_fil_rev_8_21_14_0_10_45_34]